MNDFFLFMDTCDVLNYADDNTIVFSSKTLNIMKSTIENASLQAINWFRHIIMQANPNKFQALYLSKHTDKDLHFNIAEHVLHPESSVKLLGIHFDKDLNFQQHTTLICKKAAKQVNALIRLSHVLNSSSKKKIFNTFILSNFNYCPVVYTSFTKQNMSLMEKVQERALRFVVNDFSSPYSNILQTMGVPSITMSMIRKVAEQVFKVHHGMSPPLPPLFFQSAQTSYDLRCKHNFILPKFHTVKYGKQSFEYMGAFIWNSLPINIKSSTTYTEFKTKLKNWNGPNYNCKYCI